MAYEIHLHLELTCQVQISRGAIENKIYAFLLSIFKLNFYFNHFMILKKH